MFRFALAVSLTATSLLLCAPNDAHSSQQTSGPFAPFDPAQFGITQEPVLSFTVSGSTLSGSVHEQLTVYNNGLVSIARLNQNVFGGPDTEPVDKDVDVAFVSVNEIKRLQRALKSAGAFTLPDSSAFILDIPLTTVTVMQGESTALAHTYSYYIPNDTFGPADKVIGDFIDAHFTGF